MSWDWEFVEIKKSPTVRLLVPKYPPARYTGKIKAMLLLLRKADLQELEDVVFRRYSRTFQRLAEYDRLG